MRECPTPWGAATLNMRWSLNIRKAILIWYILHTSTLYSTNNYISADHHYIVHCGDYNEFVLESLQLRSPLRSYTWYFSNSGHFFFRRKFIGKRVLYCALYSSVQYISTYYARRCSSRPGPRHDTPNAVNTRPHSASLSLVIRSNNNSSFSVFYTNARSIVNKRSLLDLEMATNAYDIAIVIETY